MRERSAPVSTMKETQTRRPFHLDIKNEKNKNMCETHCPQYLYVLCFRRAWKICTCTWVLLSCLVVTYVFVCLRTAPALWYLRKCWGLVASPWDACSAARELHTCAACGQKARGAGPEEISAGCRGRTKTDEHHVTKVPKGGL